MKKILTSFSILCYLCHLGVFACPQKFTVSGTLQLINENNICINEQIFNLTPQTTIVYKNRLSEQIITSNQIPQNALAQAKVDNNLLIYLEIYAQTNYAVHLQQQKMEKVIDINDDLDNFTLNNDGQLWAYYNLQTNQLIIQEILTEKILWQHHCSITPHFEFGPQTTNFYFTFANQDSYSLIAYNYLTGDYTTIYQQLTLNKQFINYFKIAPNERYLALTIIEGYEHSQGFNSHIKILDQTDTSSRDLPLSNVYQINWSEDSLAFSFAKYSDNLEKSIIGLYNLNEPTPLIIQRDESCSNPLLNHQQQYLIFSSSNNANLVDQIILYNLTSQKEISLWQDYNILEDLQYLNNNTLVFSTGYQPQIKLLQLHNQQLSLFFLGHLPHVFNNQLYFLDQNQYNQTYLAVLKNK